MKGGILDFAIWLLVLVALWIFALGPICQEQAQSYITTHNATGITAFLFANLNLWFYIALGISVLIRVGIALNKEVGEYRY